MRASTRPRSRSEDLLLPRCGRRRWKADRSRGSARSGSLRVAGVSVSARAPRPLAVRLDCACASSSFGGRGGGVSRAAGSECPVLVGECVCVLVPASPDPSPGSSALLFPSCLLPLRSLPKPQPPVHPRNPTPPAPRPGGRQGQGQAAEGAAASYLLVVSSPSPV